MISKRLFPVLMAVGTALSLFSCREVGEIDIEQPEFGPAEYSIVADPATTKTFNDGDATKWAEGDALSVFFNGSTILSGKFNYIGENQFKGQFAQTAGAGDWFAAYPYVQSNASASSIAVSLNIMPVQTGNDSRAHLAGVNFPLYGSVKGVAVGKMAKIQMHQAASVINFVITNDESEDLVVNSIEFTAPVKISGGFSADITADNLAWTAGEASNTITLGVNDCPAISSGEKGSFYMGVMPFSSDGEYCIRVNGTVGGETVCSERYFQKDMTFNAGKIRKLNYSFVKPEPAARYYVKVTSEPENWAGQYIIVNNESDERNRKALDVISGTSSNYTTSVTFVDGKILSTPEIDRYAVTITDAGFKHQNRTELEAYDVRNSDGKYLYYSQSQVRIADSNTKYNSDNTEDATYHHTFLYMGNGVQMMSSGYGSGKVYYKYYLQGDRDKFFYEQDKTDYRVQLYRLETGDAPIVVKKSQTLTFDSSEVTLEAGDGCTLQLGDVIDMPQTVSGAQTSVTYTSSDTSVAEIVNGSQIRIKAAGTTTIAAAAAETGEYYPASASYSITVVYHEPAPVPAEGRYVRVTSAPAADGWGGKYLVVNTADNKAFAAFDDKASSYAVDVTVVDGSYVVSTSEIDKYAVTVSGGTEAHGNNSGYRAYDVKNSEGKYIFYSQSKLRIQDNNNNSGDGGTTYTYRHTFMFDNGSVQMLSSGISNGQSKYYLGYSNGFVYQQNTASNRVHLYKYVGEVVIKKDQTLSFASSEISLDAGDGYTLQLGDVIDLPQTVNGAQTDVTYTSSDTSVAEIVNGSQIRVKAAGTTTIAAAAAETDTYNSATASYSLTVVYHHTTPTPSVACYVLVTEAPADTEWSGKYLVVNTADTKALSAFEGAKPETGNAVDVNVVDHYYVVSTSDVDKYAVTITGGTQNHAGVSGYKGYDVLNSAGLYIRGEKNGKVQVAKDKGKDNIWHALMFDSQGVTMLSAQDKSNAEKLYLGFSDNKFQYVQNGTSNRVHLYKYYEGPVKEIQTLSFSASTVLWTTGDGESYQIGSTYAMPQTVKGAKTSVTYTSSNTNIAQIVNNNQIKIVSKGTVTITATAAEDDTYSAATASYTLKVTAPSSGHYELVTEDPGESAWSGKYLVVNTADTKAFSPFKDGEGTGYNVDVLEGYYILSDEDVDGYALDITGGTENHSSISGHKSYDVKNSNGAYIYASGSAIKVSATDPGYSHAFMFDSQGVTMVSSKEGSSTNYKYYLGYSSSFVYEHDATGNRVHLYKYVDGPVKQKQTLSFSSSSVTWMVGDDMDYQIGSTYPMPQTVSGVKTTVTYSSSDTNVAQIVNSNQIKILKTGVVTITATASEDDTYKSASTSYSLIIREESVLPEVYLGSFNLESTYLTKYLDAAQNYTDDNWKTVSVINDTPFSVKWGQGGIGYDFPSPVTIKWSGNNNQRVTVSVYSDSSRSTLDQSATSTSTSVDIYNLIPNRTYYYTVALNDGTEISRGYFDTTGRRRQMKVTNTVHEYCANNVRDFGGMETVDGRTLKYGLIYRGSNMNNTGTTERTFIKDYMKIKVDVALWRDGDGARQIFDANEIAYLHVGFDGTSMNDFLNKDKVNQLFTGIINAVSQGKPIYIHCKSGADRTGYVCMLIQAVCGVSLAECSKDYEITSLSIIGTRDRCGKQHNYLFTTALNHILSADGNTFQQKAINVLKNDGGITDAQIQALQNAMIVGYGE